MKFQAVKAEKKQLKARIGIVGPSGSGKTYTALALATGLGGKIGFIDTESGSASLYADQFDFDVVNLGPPFDPELYAEAIHYLESEGYDVIVVDSLSHAWFATGGALDQADKGADRYRGNRFAAWRDVTPKHNAMVDALIGCRSHLIACMRAKQAYEQEKDEKGKTKIVKLGLAPIQRDGMEYEFDIVGDMDLQHNWIISKTRCRELDGEVIRMPGKETAERILSWLNDGTPQVPLITYEQQEKIKSLFNAINYKDYDAALNKQGFPRLIKLTEEQADQVIERLEAKK